MNNTTGTMYFIEECAGRVRYRAINIRWNRMMVEKTERHESFATPTELRKLFREIINN